jgi:hypothetical protein
MRYCIYCGGDLVEGKPLATGAQITTTGAGTGSAGKVSICPNCGKADPLNSQFCIFCGAQTGAQSPLPAKTGAARLQEPKPQAGSSKVFPLVGMIVLGLGAGGACMHFALPMLVKQPQSTSALPTKGLVVLSAKPYAEVLIGLPGDNQKPDGRSYMVGRTSADGVLSLANLPDGSYDVTIISDGEASLHETKPLKNSRPNDTTPSKEQLAVFREDGAIQSEP